jgi:hypothetical protein
MLHFERCTQRGRDAISVCIDHLIVAGWTGRDVPAIEHHIEELAALGVPRPSTTPLFYRLSTGLLTQTDSLQALGPDSSGEVEPVLVSLADGLWVGIGSDHTDRKAEAVGVALSKQMCGKVVGRQLWRFDELVGHWDSLIMRSWVTEDGTRTLYQEGTLAAMRRPEDLIDRAGGIAAGSLMFCGTLGAIGGVRPAARFDMMLEDPVLQRSLQWGYSIEVLPVVS